MSTERWTVDALNEILAPFGYDALRAASLREKVCSLQTEKLAKVEKITTVSDEQFAQEFRNLIALIKTFSREAVLIEEECILDGLCSGFLLTDASRHHWNARATRKCLLEAWVWSVLVTNIFHSPFAIFRKQCDALSDIWFSLSDTAHFHGWPIPSTLPEMWRCTTMDQMVGLVEQGAAVEDSLKEQFKHLDGAVVDAKDTIVNALHFGLERSSSVILMLKICQIVDKAFALALHMSTQRARLQVTFANVGTKFDKDAMSAMPDPRGEDQPGGFVAFTIHPGLSKWGDTHGKNLDHRYDIVPSLVQLEASMVKHGTEQGPASGAHELHKQA